jgi:hypothetical protein
MVRVHGIAVLVVVIAVGGWRQNDIAAADIARLDATAADVGRDIQSIEQSDPTLAAQSTKTLTDIRDDIAYLRVNLRRGTAVTPSEYADVRDRLETLRLKLRGASRVAAQPVIADDPMKGRLQVGTEFDVRLQTPLSSRTARQEQRFDATTMLDITQGRETIVPAGALVRGFVSSVKAAGKVDRTGSLTLSFDELMIDGRVSKLRASIVKALDPSVAQDATRIGAGAAVGAVIGGLFAGGKGALVGVLIGGGGTMASTEGSDVDLPAGTVLRIRLDQPLVVE